MSIVFIVTLVAALFLVIGLAEPIAGRLRLPYSVILAVLGTLIGIGASFFLATELTDALNPLAAAVLNLPIRANVFLYVFLPTLLFQATLGVNIRRMLDDWVPILVLAVIAVLFSTVAIGVTLGWASGLPIAACLLLGAIVSTTDPSAVVSIFRSISAPRRLARIIEGESLLNDAAAIALFGLFIGYVSQGSPDPRLLDAVLRFPGLVAGGLVTGWLLSRAALALMVLCRRFELAQISISVSLPYLTYIAAEQLVGASGVIAVVAAGLTLNLAGPGRLTPSSWSNLREVWELLAHWAGALIFILAALLIPRMLEAVRPSDLMLISLVTLTAIAARAVILFGLLPLLTRVRLSPAVDRPYRTAILWGGLRGAVTLALALAVTESTFVPLEVKRLIGILATGFTLFTLLIQGTTLRWVIQRLGLAKLSAIDEALSRQVVAVSLQAVREDVSKATATYDLNREVVRAEAKSFGRRLDEAVKAAEESTEILDRDRVTLGLLALAGAERDLILERLRERIISSRQSERALADAGRLIEATRSGGRHGYQHAARNSVAFRLPFKVAVVLHRRLRISLPLARLTADRFERLLSQRLILRDLEGFVDGRIRRIHGRRVAELLSELLARRQDAVEAALEGLRLQYPGYADELERRFIRRTTLRMEEREYGAMLEDGLIGAELHNSLMQGLTRRRARAERRPRLDLALQRSEVVRQFPLFEELDSTVVKQLARVLETRYVNAGQTIIAEDGVSAGVYFVASGAVELKTAAQTWRLGRGEMFGQMAPLLRKPRRGKVVALAPSTLLLLDERAYLRLLERSPKMRAAVRQSALKRGIKPERLNLQDE
ncbi:cation:proton antiporter [Pelagovum pacificum]|uniref:Cyclic nucleotide-binding domain-containing protein n=1 Tax=Pelagovum pacificum TaxID=2588711 RepID=A0A5C5GCM4_9RHOB|nr:cation:proton antiporter [Pelagovum pacificum]QQA44319.1 cation:proton antiporter [Pelagovum pacificum]TNY32562.1 cyclic nucleotide-binding domain-containing protein [Pelagovum pacificum]